MQVEGTVGHRHQWEDQPPASAGVFFFGDSTLFDVMRDMHGAGDVQESRTPAASLKVQSQYIASHPGALKGATVFISGVSNDKSQFHQLASAIKLARDEGARVYVLGMGDRPDLAALNGKVAQTATDNGAEFLPMGANNGIHPTAALAASFKPLVAARPADGGSIIPVSAVEPQAPAGETTPGTAPSARPGAKPPARSTLTGGAVAPQQAHDAFQQALKAQTPEGEKLRHALDDIKKTGGTPEEKEFVQQALKKAGYNLGGYGANHDGIDGILGPLTSAALRAATDDNGFVDQLTPEWRHAHPHPRRGHASGRHAHPGRRPEQRRTGHAEHTPHAGDVQHGPQPGGHTGRRLARHDDYGRSPV